MAGLYDSSLTRVRPFFEHLLENREPGGKEWLSRILRAAPEATAVADPELLREPGELYPALRERAGKTRTYRCFEHPVPPSAHFLEHLIRNPDLLERAAGDPDESSGKSQEWRRKLIRGSSEERREARDEALSELREKGPWGARQMWWAFEGMTRVDCWLETEKLILIVEGKRTEKVSSRTAWFPPRDQLTRNLDAVRELGQSREKAAFVLLAVQDKSTDIQDTELARAAPHLEPDPAAKLRRHYLGQAAWADLCRAVGIDYASLPNMTADIGTPLRDV